MMRIVLTGGGTGGHIVPLITVAQKIKEKTPDAEFIFMGQGGEMAENFMRQAGIPVKSIWSGKVRRYFSPLNFLDAFKVPVGIIQSLFWLLVYMPDAVFGKGGHGSVPVVLAAWAYRIPVLIHESDSNPGLANSMLSKFAERVAVSYPEAEKYFPSSQVVLTGNPVRTDIAQGDAEKARREYNLIESRKTIFVVGGSQGARIINSKIVEILPELLKKYQVIHQTGKKNFDDVCRKAGELGIKAGYGGYFPLALYGDELKDILAASDLVVSRASATTISEIAAAGKPAILIPLENSANNHQKMNAYSVAKRGGCLVLEEENLGEIFLFDKITEIMEDEQLRNKLSTNIRAFYHPDAAEKIVEGILGMIARE
ncbi:MAG: undecaprenyldiphospho-muramoylpentapeptide beta-N-acetylglucosaminyltransferase [Candidatus Moranbacteria bacterium RIFOXYA12_FULL_44_15]|nr:MAG: undecaprenyldiphospho-muramoylpentapeptide beta-N-acetylglucosaminyltransferase [Candidatus Moranbacteria bacterium RIFOXYA12_FULL_44_15]OGI36417.1 MAG: undecaprenyldiphospho-muramoylpentapeptide beta-N-acetylglucosaminyltransferase [Candidatus Moranbacteria bacterium RIFOXYA2_FULL_43_15]